MCTGGGAKRSLRLAAADRVLFAPTGVVPGDGVDGSRAVAFGGRVSQPCDALSVSSCEGGDGVLGAGAVWCWGLATIGSGGALSVSSCVGGVGSHVDAEVGQAACITAVTWGRFGTGGAIGVLAGVGVV